MLASPMLVSGRSRTARNPRQRSLNYSSVLPRPLRKSSARQRQRVAYCKSSIPVSLAAHRTADETGIYLFHQEYTRQSTMRTLEGEEPPTKFRRSRSVGMMVATTFFMRSDHAASTPLRSQSSETVNSDWHCSTCRPALIEAVLTD